MKLLILLSCVFTSVFAKDKFRLSLLLAAQDNVERFEDVDEDSFKGSRLGLAALIESESLKGWRIESGAIKTSRQYSIKDQGKTIIEEVERVHIPLIAKYYIGEFALGGGLYSALSISDEERASQDNFSSSENTSAEKEESGWMGSTSYQYAIKNSTSLILDLRWVEPFVSKNSEETNNFFAMAGVKFEI